MSEGEVRGLCLKSREIFLSQPILLELEAPLKICGIKIIHFFRCFLFCIIIIFQVIFMVNILIYYVYLIMVDFLRNRIIYFWVIMQIVGNNHLKLFVYYLLIKFGKKRNKRFYMKYLIQIKYPENFFLLRGNHECASINRIYGFYDECKRRYNIKLWKTFTDCFNCLPIAAIIDEKIFCCHGGKNNFHREDCFIVR